MASQFLPLDLIGAELLAGFAAAALGALIFQSVNEIWAGVRIERRVAALLLELRLALEHLHELFRCGVDRRPAAQ